MLNFQQFMNGTADDDSRRGEGVGGIGVGGPDNRPKELFMSC